MDQHLISELFKRKYGLIICVLILCLTSATFGSNDGDRTNELPHCKPTISKPSSRSMIVVSTLDGHVTALDTIKGSVLWSLDTDPGALLKSTISSYEFITRGKSSRLVPSLNGDLFTFDGESMDAIPISADNLLSNSMKISDDTVIIGGKEINVYGVQKDTGELMYSCGIENCKYQDDVIQNSNDGLLLVRRMTRTVRALSTSSGIEKWNYSVGQHEVSLASPSLDDEGCHQYNQELHANFDEDENLMHHFSNLSVRFASSEGTIYVFNEFITNRLVWQHKFSSPIVHAWNVTDKKVQSFDLFDCHYNSEFDYKEGRKEASKPSLFVGMYQQQLYIMQSKKLVESLPLEWRTFGLNLYSAPPRVTWKPYLITSHSRTPIISGQFPSIDDDDVTCVKGDGENTALVIGHNEIEYPFDSGFYLYADKANSQTTDNLKFVEEESIDQIIVSLWYWWKEVLLISVTFAIVLNIIIAKCLRIRRRCLKEENREIVIELMTNKTESVLTTKESNTHSSNNSTSQMGTPPVEFVSRYLTDFEPLESLGKGGFGIVFRARNKIDDCEYAIKRISMPSNKDSKERILREVKTLAKLDHVSIVRYYNSWLECPPVDWKTTMDKSTNSENIVTPSSSITVDDINQTFSNRAVNNAGGNSINVLNNNNAVNSHKLRNLHVPELSEVFEESSTCSNLKLRIDKKRPNETSSDSFIVFESGNSTSIAAGEEINSLNNNGRLSSELSDSYLPKFELDSMKSGINHLSFTNTDESSKAQANDANVQSENFPPWAQPTKTLLYIQMQLCRKDSLKDWLSEHYESRNKIEVLDIFCQIVGAVEYVHDQGLMHRDLKPSNIFFALDGSIKVGDFGLVTNMSPNQKNEDAEIEESKSSSTRHTNQVGTTLYMSPEQIAGTNYNHKVDVYSLGLVFFELLVPFTTAMERIKTMNNARAMKFSPDFVGEWPREHGLVKQMLELAPQQRPTASEILNHPLLEEFHLRPERMRRRTRTMSRTYSFSSNESGQGSTGNDSK